MRKFIQDKALSLRIALLLLFLYVISTPLLGQVDSTKHQLIISGYTDVYVAAFSDSLGPNALQAFTTVSPRSHRFGLNVAQITAAYRSPKIRSHVTLHWGDIAQATWSEEFRAVQEANLGLLLEKDLWLDAGFFRTHIGTESFLPKNNLLSSTAVATYNEPFFQSGARLAYEGWEKWQAELWIVSGYNFFLDVNNAKSVGLLLAHQFNSNTSLTYTNLLGRESADSVYPQQFRTYQNLYLNAALRKKWTMVLGGDLGIQTNSKRDQPQETAFMYNALATLRYQFLPAFSFTARGEVFQDRHGVISGLLPTMGADQEGLRLWGATLGGEYIPQEGAYVRGEVRCLKADDQLEIFFIDGRSSRRWEAMLTMGYNFNKFFSL